MRLVSPTKPPSPPGNFGGGGGEPARSPKCKCKCERRGKRVMRCEEGEGKGGEEFVNYLYPQVNKAGNHGGPSGWEGSIEDWCFGVLVL